MEISWGSLVALAGSAGLISAAFTQGITWLREWRTTSVKSKASASYLALRLAVTLEGYAYACASLIAKNNSAPPREDGHPDLIITVPELPGYPDDADGWRAMDVKLAGRCLDLRNRIGGSQGLIFSVLDVDEDAVWDTVAEQVSERGLEAWSIARDLRRKYDLDKVDLVWDFLHFLEVTLKDAKERLEVEQEGKAHHLAELSADDRRAGVP